MVFHEQASLKGWKLWWNWFHACPLLSPLLTSSPPSPFCLFFFQFGLLIIPGGVQKGSRRDKVAPRCRFPTCVIFESFLFKDVVAEKGRVGGVGRECSLASEVGWHCWLPPVWWLLTICQEHKTFPCPSSPSVNLTPGHWWDVFLRKWLAIWSERPHICPANENAGLLPICLR